jgi:hypothetical protein
MLFIAMHTYWFAGGRIGFGDNPNPIPGPPSTSAEIAFNVVVLAMFGAGLIVPLALAQPWGRNIPDGLLLTLAWLGCAVLSARGIAGIVDGVGRVTGLLPLGLTGLRNETVLGQEHPPPSTIAWSFAIDAYFVVGGVLFGLVAARFQRANRSGGSPRLR